MTLLSGDVVSAGSAVWRSVLVAGYVAAMLLGIAAIGLFVSTLTEVPMGAMAATAVLVIVAEIADTVPQIGWLHPYLFTHYWLAFGDLLRQPIDPHDSWCSDWCPRRRTSRSSGRWPGPGSPARTSPPDRSGGQ